MFLFSGEKIAKSAANLNGFAFMLIPHIMRHYHSNDAVSAIAMLIGAGDFDRINSASVITGALGSEFHIMFIYYCPVRFCITIARTILRLVAAHTQFRSNYAGTIISCGV